MNLKLVSAIFYQIFENYEKCFLFHLKSSFRSRDIQIFVFSGFPLLFPLPAIALEIDPGKILKFMTSSVV